MLNSLGAPVVVLFVPPSYGYDLSFRLSTLQVRKAMTNFDFIPCLMNPCQVMISKTRKKKKKRKKQRSTMHATLMHRHEIANPDPDHLFQQWLFLLLEKPVLLLDLLHLPPLVQTPNKRLQAADYYSKNVMEVFLTCVAAARVNPSRDDEGARKSCSINEDEREVH